MKLVETTGGYYFIKEQNANEKVKYKVHAEFKFDSDRKRMSVLIEENGKFFLYTKGADNQMISQINFSGKEEEDVLKGHLYKFAVQGLRTLVMGKREVSTKEKDEIVDGIYNIQSSADKNKGEQLFNLYCKHEVDLTYVGASAIEDKLQDKVPETIDKLMQANIRLWVLTGDKQETAIEIAKSCQLIQPGMEMIELSIPMKDRKKLEEESDEQFHRRIEAEKQEYKDELREKIVKAKNEYLKNAKITEEEDIFREPLKKLKFEGDQIALVIDGPTLGLILEDEELGRAFLSVGLYSKSVICCRVSPKQKSEVVAIVNKVKPGCIRLSIGDGANDVPMIMEANIGVGIRGKEGTQAVRSSDYAISQFKYLEKLLLFHGRLGYRRVSWMV